MSSRIIKYLECDCGGAEHVLRIVIDDDGDVFIDMALNHYFGFWRRLWTGIRYAFGHRSRHGYFAELVTSREKLAQLLREVDMAFQHKAEA